MAKAREAGDELDGIVAGTEEVTRLIDEIAQATGRQQASVRQVESSIARIAELIGVIHGAARAGVDRAEAMTDMAGTLHRSVGSFRVA